MTDRDMFDTMTLTKITAALCTALLILVLGGWVGDQIYSPGHHGDDHHQAYTIDTGVKEEAEVVDAGPDIETLLASADAEKGAASFKRKCSACHSINDGENGTGPHLSGIADRALGSVDGYAYSGGFAEVADAWSAANLNSFIKKPKAFASNTKMGFAGIGKDGERADLIAYLQSL